MSRMMTLSRRQAAAKRALPESAMALSGAPAAANWTALPPGARAGALGHDFSRVAVRAPQAKLTVNQPGDRYEREADAVADRVVGMPSLADRVVGLPSAAPFAAVQRCPCEDEKVARKETGAAAETGDVSGVVSAGTASGGFGMDAGTRSAMEAGFGHDFGSVRIHTDSRASRSAEMVSARAYTLGSDVVFRSGEYSPGSQEGRRLLAHELTHVVQQGAASSLGSESMQRKLDISQADGLVQRDDLPAPNTTDPTAGTTDLSSCNDKIDEDVAQCADEVNKACSIKGAAEAAIGAVGGATIGLLAGPVGAAIGGTIGAVAGGVYGALDYGDCVKEQAAGCRAAGRNAKKKCAEKFTPKDPETVSVPTVVRPN